MAATDSGSAHLVTLRRGALEVLIGELAKREAELDAPTRDALGEARGALQMPAAAAAPMVLSAPDGTAFTVPAGGAQVMVVQRSHEHDVRCNWRLIGPNSYRCDHGLISAEHPNGYCDQGCCR